MDNKIILNTSSYFTDHWFGLLIVASRTYPKFLSQFKYSPKIFIPSKELLADYKKKEIDWSRYEVRYNKELDECFDSDIFSGFLDVIPNFCRLFMKKKLTFLCWEHVPEYCHRRLLVERLLKDYSEVFKKGNIY